MLAGQESSKIRSRHAPVNWRCATSKSARGPHRPQGLTQAQAGVTPVSVDRPLGHGCRRSPTGLRAAIQRHCNDRAHSEVDVTRLHRSRYLRYQKPVIDRVGAGLLLAVMAPLFLMIAAAIRLDSRGPLLFRQERSGRLGRRFTMFKFRTMVSDAELRKHALLHLNIHETGSPDFKLRDDPRITRVGRFLRKTSLDELPNLINVLRGDMSLVGPRPTSFDASTYQPHQLARLAATPGITGVWQVSGRANVDFETRAAMDIEYINRASLGYDLRILLVTPFKMHAGAY